jgi:hypothetical protein
LLTIWNVSTILCASLLIISFSLKDDTENKSRGEEMEGRRGRRGGGRGRKILTMLPVLVLARAPLLSTSDFL